MLEITIKDNPEGTQIFKDLKDAWTYINSKYLALDDQYAGVVDWNLYDTVQDYTIVGGHPAALWFALSETPGAFKQILKISFGYTYKNE